MGSSFGVALLPWLTFVVAARTGGVGPPRAALLALACALVVLVRARRGGERPTFERASVVTLAVLTLAAVSLQAPWQQEDRYSRAAGALCLAVLAFASLARSPLTAQYARASVRLGQLRGAAFGRVNRAMTAVIGAGALAAAASFLAGSWLRGGVPSTIANWLVPLALVLSCAWCCRALWDRAMSDDEPEEQALLASVAVPLGGRQGRTGPVLYRMSPTPPGRSDATPPRGPGRAR